MAYDLNNLAGKPNRYEVASIPLTSLTINGLQFNQKKVFLQLHFYTLKNASHSFVGYPLNSTLCILSVKQ